LLSFCQVLVDSCELGKTDHHDFEEDLARRWFQRVSLIKQEEEEMTDYTATSGKNNESKLSYLQK
jgi:hypothetical protein